MHAAALRLDLRIRDARSLKEKRQVIKSVSAHVGRTFGVAVAEVDHQDLWNRATLGVAAVALIARGRGLDARLPSVRLGRAAPAAAAS